MENVITKKITVARVAYWSVGVRLWFVIQATDGARYQRWSLDMDSSDECLMLAKPDDKLTIDYLERGVDQQNKIQSNVIRTVEFV